MISADAHGTGGGQGRVTVVVPLQTAPGIARALRVLDPAGPRKLDTSALPVAGVMAARCRAMNRLIPAIVIPGLGPAMMPLIARDDIKLILTLRFAMAAATRARTATPAATVAVRRDHGPRRGPR